MKQKFNVITSTCIPLPLENVDTDQIIPARYLKLTQKVVESGDIYAIYEKLNPHTVSVEFCRYDGELGGWGAAIYQPETNSYTPGSSGTFCFGQTGHHAAVSVSVGRNADLRRHAADGAFHVGSVLCVVYTEQFDPAGIRESEYAYCECSGRTGGTDDGGLRAPQVYGYRSV